MSRLWNKSIWKLLPTPPTGKPHPLFSGDCRENLRFFSFATFLHQKTGTKLLINSSNVSAILFPGPLKNIRFCQALSTASLVLWFSLERWPWRGCLILFWWLWGDLSLLGFIHICAMDSFYTGSHDAIPDSSYDVILTYRGLIQVLLFWHHMLHYFCL